MSRIELLFQLLLWRLKVIVSDLGSEISWNDVVAHSIGDTIKDACSGDPIDFKVKDWPIGMTVTEVVKEIAELDAKHGPIWSEISREIANAGYLICFQILTRHEREMARWLEEKKASGDLSDHKECGGCSVCNPKKSGGK